MFLKALPVQLALLPVAIWCGHAFSHFCIGSMPGTVTILGRNFYSQCTVVPGRVTFWFASPDQRSFGVDETRHSKRTLPIFRQFRNVGQPFRYPKFHKWYILQKIWEAPAIPTNSCLYKIGKTAFVDWELPLNSTLP